MRSAYLLANDPFVERYLGVFVIVPIAIGIGATVAYSRSVKRWGEEAADLFVKRLGWGAFWAVALFFLGMGFFLVIRRRWPEGPFVAALAASASLMGAWVAYALHHPPRWLQRLFYRWRIAIIQSPSPHIDTEKETLNLKAELDRMSRTRPAMTGQWLTATLERDLAAMLGKKTGETRTLPLRAWSVIVGCLVEIKEMTALPVLVAHYRIPIIRERHGGMRAEIDGAIQALIQGNTNALAAQVLVLTESDPLIAVEELLTKIAPHWPGQIRDEAVSNAWLAKFFQWLCSRPSRARAEVLQSLLMLGLKNHAERTCEALLQQLAKNPTVNATAMREVTYERQNDVGQLEWEAAFESYEVPFDISAVSDLAQAELGRRGK